MMAENEFFSGLPSASFLASFALNKFVSPIAVDAGCEKRPKRILVTY